MMKKGLLIVFFIFYFFSATPNVYGIKFISAPLDASIQSSLTWEKGNTHRQMILLNGEWNYRIPDTNNWKKVNIPASCNYDGEIIFQRFFNVDSTFQNKSFKLICYGINYYCEIFINDKFIGSHASGYSSFYINIPADFVFLERDNTIEIKVNTRLDTKNTIPTRFQPNGVKNTAGIFRSLYILALPDLSIKKPKINYTFNSDFTSCQLGIQFNLIGKDGNLANLGERASQTQKFSYLVEIFSTSSNKIISRQKKEIDVAAISPTLPISHEISIKNPQLWSPATPFLYKLKIKLLQKNNVIDEHQEVLGLKQLDFFDGNIFLNGERLYLKGVNWRVI